MTDTAQRRRTLIDRILNGPGSASSDERRAAFNNSTLADPLKRLVQKVAVQATSVSDGDLAAARASGLTQDQIFEIVVCAAVGQSARQHKAAREALDSARREG